ncbi:HD domain-containing protein [Niveibacterium sp. 24ML]|uniref:HD domain-containing protein n=1 Tax=Niveibacterium sp. 24ML TaxID=2985512 RepID=UPI002270F026|nr:HD domain-containing protein [Niveibacterium sp. 24ML]MCX9158389.1 HD domain-containing protein [Niveibacterium sp. 24ML]
MPPSESLPTAARLAAQIRFILEIDKLKGILRQSWLLDESRRENSAEHSWHVAMMALVLAEHANAPVDASRAAMMLMIHDLVEIDAGDTFAYDTAAHADKHARELAAADRLFGLLPDDCRDQLRALWDEFEAAETMDARYANALDRLMPMLHNLHTEGRAWQANGVTADKVYARNGVIANGSETLWAYAREVIETAVTKGYLAPGAWVEPGASSS